MALIPKKTKFRKAQRLNLKGRKASAGSTLCFGEFGLQVLEFYWLKTTQIESARKAITHCLKRGGKVWIRVCADKPYSARAAETRMGSGKGEPVGYAAVVKPGHILFEIAGVSEEVAKEAMRLAGHKLPVETRFVVKH
ncbi:MAG: 50S ribosomal protein L16 [Candidatus Margulisbacteria bacterium]|nr:50S ribosomal protein L16 [Candidatus Margulisiibacteriota bacterium]MBU1022100.1 50S ribosomal protein L16 [Candidatus Margulisiibacteriota bacterium]MBU1729695.1 50S ribosomal protein L16 [Candidatus Margulisiibacteriota bacterium]MBU1955015.1 50S ribosomal protein L16 [Candidatus Margulisiibacteriota bacterium]